MEKYLVLFDIKLGCYCFVVWGKFKNDIIDILYCKQKISIKYKECDNYIETNITFTVPAMTINDVVHYSKMILDTIEYEYPSMKYKRSESIKKLIEF